MRNFLFELCNAAELKSPELLADQLALSLEGAIVTAQVSQDSRAARAAAETLPPA